MAQPRVAVIGTGTMGSQVLWQLSQLDCEAVGYELFSPGHPRGAASGENRIFMNLELEDVRFTPVVNRATELWQKLERESGTQLRDLQGVVAFAEEGTEPTAVALESVAERGDRVQVFTPAEARERFPKFAINDDELAIFDRDGGLIFPDRTIRAAASLAVENGIALHTSARISAISERNGQVLITAEDGRTDTFDRVVVAAGAWTATLLPELAPYLETRRLLSTWFKPKLRE